MEIADIRFNMLGRMSDEISEEQFSAQLADKVFHAVKVTFISTTLARLELNYRREEPITVERILIFREIDNKAVCEIILTKGFLLSKEGAFVTHIESSKLIME